MLKIYEDYLDQLKVAHDDIKRALDGLPQEALDWAPGPDMNSLAVLVVHTTGAERYWIGDIAGRDPSQRDRDAEFRVRGLDAAALQKRLDDALGYARGALDKMTIEDLVAPRTVPRDGQVVTVAGALFHALRHAALHAGHMQMVRQLWDQRA